MVSKATWAAQEIGDEGGWRVSGPEAVEVEGKLAVVLDGEEDHLVPANEVEEQVLIQDELSKVVAGPDESPEASAGGARFQGSGGVIEKVTARLWELAECGDEVVEQVIQQASEGGAPGCAEKIPDSVKVLGEVLSEDGAESPTGHIERAIDARSGCGRQQRPPAPFPPHPAG